MSGRLAVCRPCPSRGRDPAGALGPAGGGRRGLRGRAGRVCCSSATASRPSSSLRAQRAAAGGGAGLADALRRGGRIGLGRRHAARLGPGLRAGAGARGGCRLPVKVLPGPLGRGPRSWRRGLPADERRFAGFLPRARRVSCGRSCRSRRGRSWRSILRRLPATLELLASLSPEREAAVCRELTKAHEEVVRGRRPELASRYAGAPPEGGRAGAGAVRRGLLVSRGGARGAAEAWSTRARARARRRRSWPR